MSNGVVIKVIYILRLQLPNNINTLDFNIIGINNEKVKKAVLIFNSEFIKTPAVFFGNELEGMITSELYFTVERGNESAL